MADKNMTKRKSGSTNFLISIHYNENHSWQGTLQWLDTGKQLFFRSELELLTLMNAAVQSGQDHDQLLRTWDEDAKLTSIK